MVWIKDRNKDVLEIISSITTIDCNLVLHFKSLCYVYRKVVL